MKNLLSTGSLTGSTANQHDNNTKFDMRRSLESRSS